MWHILLVNYILQQLVVLDLFMMLWMSLQSYFQMMPLLEQLNYYYCLCPLSRPAELDDIWGLVNESDLLITCNHVILCRYIDQRDTKTAGDLQVLMKGPLPGLNLPFFLPLSHLGAPEYSAHTDAWLRAETHISFFRIQHTHIRIGDTCGVMTSSERSSWLDCWHSVVNNCVRGKDYK